MKQNLTKRWSLLASVAMLLLATTITARGDEPTTTPDITD